MTTKKWVFIAFLGLIVCLLTSFGTEYKLHPAGFLFDLPEGWEPVGEPDDQLISFAEESKSAFFQIYSFPATAFESSGEIYRYIQERLDAQGEAARFPYNGNPAIFADLRFNVSESPVRGYAVFLNGSDFDLVLLTFALNSEYATKHDALLSALDSFALNKEERTLPGPVSQFYYPLDRVADPARQAEFDLFINDTPHSLRIDSNQHEASQLVIEREARILALSSGEDIDSWERFYRIIYRDNYVRLKPVFELLEDAFGNGRAADGRAANGQIAQSILQWLQSWQYTRTGSLSDVLGPIEAVLTSKGDCDSKGLVYVILLHHFEIDAVMFVSSQYGHSICGVDVGGAGARINSEGKSFLVAETTEDVSIGLIAADMADPNAWVPVEFYQSFDS